jgi:iron complex transport system permease protein
VIVDAAVVARSRRRTHERTTLVAGALVIGVFAAFCFSVSVGDFPIRVLDVVPALIGSGNEETRFIVRELRLPRALTGLLVGAAFGCSGAIFQTLARNPLASPDIIGISAGASTGAVAAIVLFHAGATTVALAAFCGALATALAIYVLAYKRGISAYRLVLVGIGLGAVCASLTSYLLTRAQIFQAQRAQVWLVGSLNGSRWEDVRMLVATLLVLTPAAALLARPLRALQLGDDVARGLGVGVQRAYTALLLTGVGLAAVGTAAAGPIAFVAFAAPAITRRLAPAAGITLFPAALAGALLVLVADVMGRRVLEPNGLPVGVVTGILGAPYLLYLLARANRIGSGG